MLVGANERRSEDLQVEAVQGRGLREFSAEIGIPADHGALTESVVRLENEFAVQETGARLPVVRAGTMEGSSISTLAIGVPRSVVRRAMAELSSGDVDDRTALATELINRSSPEFAARYVEERLREYRRGAARKEHHSPFDSLVTVTANATTPLFVAAREEESVPPTRTLQSANAMNPQHKSPWGVYTFRDLWTHHSIPCTLLVAAIAFGCYGISTIVDIGTYLWAFGIIITSMILGTTGYLRSHFGKDQSAFPVPLFSLIFAWFTVGAVLVVANHYGASLLNFLDTMV